MSEEDRERLREFLEEWDPKGTLEAFKRGEADLSLIDPEIAYEDTILPDHVGETYHGYEGIARATERWLEPFESVTVELERIVGTEDRLVSIHQVEMKAEHTGLDFEANLAYVWTFRDGKVIHLKSYWEPGEALEAAGLQEQAISQENVEIVRSLIGDMNAFMRGELSSEAYVEGFDPQIEIRWYDRQTYPDTPQHLRGGQDCLAFTEKWRDGWADTVVEPLELVEAPGDRVLGFVRQTGKGRQSGVPIEVHYFQLWTIRDGKVRQMEYFRHRADALEAAELSE